MKSTKVIALVIIALLLQGCTAILFPEKMVKNDFSKKLSSMLGYSERELRTQWGPPSRIIDNASAGEVFVYDKGSVTKHSPGSALITGGNNYLYGTAQKGSSYNYDRWVRFYLSNGRVYKWETHGLKTKVDKNKGWRWVGVTLDIVIGGALFGWLLIAASGY
jgi:hypothetical protein